jgi:hypothetical protein
MQNESLSIYDATYRLLGSLQLSPFHSREDRFFGFLCETPIG